MRSQRPSVKTDDYTEECVDCGGPRHRCSGQRCIGCYRKRAQGRLSMRNANKWFRSYFTRRWMEVP